jgi:hypothetical protein
MYELHDESEKRLTRLETLGEDLNRDFGIVEGGARAVVEASELLEYLGVRRVLGEYSLIRLLGGEEL